MSTPEHPATPALTRKQMRDMRNTGANPVITEPGPTSEEAQAPADTQPAPRTAPPAQAPLPRAAVPVPVHDLPAPDATVDLGVTPLTRRQARQQERIRTASVPVITPEIAAAHVKAPEAPETGEQRAAEEIASDEIIVPDGTADGEVLVEEGAGSDAGAATEDTASGEVLVAEIIATSENDLPGAGGSPVQEPAAATLDEISPTPADTPRHEPSAAVQPDVEPQEEPAEREPEKAVVGAQFGADLLTGAAVQPDLPPSFDQLISRAATGSIGAGNALILSQTPSAPNLVAPVTATGEVLITGSFDLPSGLGSTGHADGTADGKDVDAVLVDGELPAHSSPTPIAASAAISTVKNDGDIIKPPTPEKGGRLMLTLAITAGALALALVGVLILAFATGVF